MISEFRGVKVAEFRNGTERLSRLARVDYCACKGVHELRTWTQIATRALAQVDTTQCDRANAHDIEHRADAVALTVARLEAAEQTITRLETESPAITDGFALVNDAEAALRLALTEQFETSATEYRYRISLRSAWNQEVIQAHEQFTRAYDDYMKRV